MVPLRAKTELAQVLLPQAEVKAEAKQEEATGLLIFSWTWITFFALYHVTKLMVLTEHLFSV